MEEVSLADQDYELWVLLYWTKDAIYKAREKELRKWTLSPMWAAVLFTVQAIGSEAILSEISRWLFRKPHSVAGIVRRMEKEGLVKTARDLHRKNLVRVTMTETGQQALHQVTKGEEAIHSIMSCLSQEERQQLRSCLERLLSKAFTELGIQRQLPLPWS